MNFKDILHSAKTQTFPHITRKRFCESMDEILDDIEKNSTAYVLTEEGKHDLLVCPAEWFGAMFDSDFDLIVCAAVRYSIGRKTYMPGVVSDFINKYLHALSDKTLFNIRTDIERELRNESLDQYDLWKNLLKTVVRELQDRKETE